MFPASLGRPSEADYTRRLLTCGENHCCDIVYSDGIVGVGRRSVSNMAKQTSQRRATLTETVISPFLSWRFVKFCIVGASGVVVNLGFLRFFKGLEVQVNLASAMAIEISIISNFLINYSWTFRGRGSADQSLLVQGLRFQVVSMVGATVQFLAFVVFNMAWLLTMFDIPTITEYHSAADTWLERWLWHPFVAPPDVGNWVYLSQLLGIGIGTFWNYLINFHWTWAGDLDTAMHSERHDGAATLICIPTYNEAENVTRIVPAVLEQVPRANVLVVDDNSPDGTGQLADRMAGEDSRVHVLHRKGKEGLGKAYLAAFQWALERNYQYIFEFDADFSHNPEYLPVFAGLLHADKADVLVGSRRVKGGGVENWSLHRRFISWGGSLYARIVLGLGIRDLTGGFNGFRRAVLESIELDRVTSTGYCFQIELKYRAVKRGFRVLEQAIVFPDRVLGKSKMNGAIFAEAVVQVWKLRRVKPAQRHSDPQ